ncbi:hemerythrin domain-containing protein [Aspergillus foveolatus]|uniref:hemerythrin domain-containing protein n=1 Tax=Aspergillus foveolatus TaxID=210207 RepID=UPI003CCCCBE9
MSAGSTQQEPELPPLSPKDFRIYNQLADKMDYFHTMLRHGWDIQWKAATTGRRPQGMSVRQFIAEGLRFASHLETHHAIEEQHIFPHLALKMPEFRVGKGKNNAELLRQHKQIHVGLDGFRDYLEKCLSGEEDLQLDVLKAKMESWKDVLWTHLDQEVKTLGAENMRKYWNKEEIGRIPF